MATAQAPEPSDPRHHSAKQLWAVEYLDRRVAGAVVWHQDVRLRHVGSGKYLALNTDAVSRRRRQRARSFSFFS